MPIWKVFYSLMAAVALMGAPLARAAEVRGAPVPGGVALQHPATVVMRDTVWMDDFLLWIISAIVALVMVLLLIVIFRFNHRVNPKPARFSHNSTLEVIWTAIPVMILVAIAIPSLRLLYLQLEVPKPDLTVKVTGNQWYWSYEYPEQGIEFDAFMIGQGSATLTDEVRAELHDAGYTDDFFKLATDERMVVPKGANVHVLVTGADVIHSWAVPSFGVKIDAIPGRLNESWFRADQTGLYFGQCSELCGKDHAYMPIVVEVVEPEDFKKWVAAEQAKMHAPTEVARR